LCAYQEDKGVCKRQSGDKAQQQADDHAHLLKRVRHAHGPEPHRTTNEISERRIWSVKNITYYEK